MNENGCICEICDINRVTCKIMAGGKLEPLTLYCDDCTGFFKVCRACYDLRAKLDCPECRRLDQIDAENAQFTPA
jgi:hypothetical protein